MSILSSTIHPSFEFCFRLQTRPGLDVFPHWIFWHSFLLSTVTIHTAGGKFGCQASNFLTHLMFMNQRNMLNETENIRIYTTTNEETSLIRTHRAFCSNATVSEHFERCSWYRLHSTRTWRGSSWYSRSAGTSDVIAVKCETEPRSRGRNGGMAASRWISVSRAGSEDVPSATTIISLCGAAEDRTSRGWLEGILGDSLGTSEMLKNTQKHAVCGYILQ